jgi:light-regulated signal transduction histidine kinase (bacteriophytochrome)
LLVFIFKNENNNYRRFALGLGICYAISARHNAKIDIETGPEGTTFYIYFWKNHEGESKKECSNVLNLQRE